MVVLRASGDWRVLKDIGSATLAVGGTVEGTVYDPEGRLSAGVTLQFQDDSGYSGGGDEEAGRVATVTTDEEGHYRVEHLARQKLYVNVADHWSRSGVVRRLVRPLDGKVRCPLRRGAHATSGH